MTCAPSTFHQPLDIQSSLVLSSSSSFLFDAVWEYPVCRAYVDARVQPIYGGSNEIMKELIARDL